MPASPISSRDRIALTLAATCWGLGTVVSKAALGEFPPLTLFAIQLATSLVVLALLLWRQGTPLRQRGRPTLTRLGLLNPGTAYALGLIGLLSISASLSVLLWALEPLMILGLATVVLGERIGPRLIGLSGIALVGVAIVVLAPGTASGQLVGVALTTLGVACCAAYTVVTRKLLPGAIETGAVVFGQQAWALGLAIPLVVTAAVLGGPALPASVTALGIASAVGSGVLYYAAAYWLYLGALRRVPASIASSWFYLIPIVGIAASAVLLGERLEPIQWLGVVLVIGSVIGITRIPDSPATAAATS